MSVKGSVAFNALNDKQKALLTKAGFSLSALQQFLALLGEYGPQLLQIILAILAGQNPTPPPTPAPAKAAAPGCCDHHACCQEVLAAALQTAALAADHCCQCCEEEYAS